MLISRHCGDSSPDQWRIQILWFLKDRPGATNPRRVRSTSPRLSKARGKFISHLTGAVTANAPGYLTPTSHYKFAKILTWLFKAKVSASIKSSTLRPQMQNVMLFQ